MVSLWPSKKSTKYAFIALAVLFLLTIFSPAVALAEYEGPSITVDPTPTLTNNKYLTVTGHVDGEYDSFDNVYLTVNGIETHINVFGHFSKDLVLSEGTNTITVVARQGYYESTTVVRTVVVDSTPPTLSFNAPSLTNNPLLNITGTVEAGSTVKINGTPVTVNGTSFNYTYNLIEGNNTITAVATDVAGNKTTLTKNVTLDTIPPHITVDNTPVLTNNAVLNVTGSVEDGSTVTVNGQTAALNGTTFSKSLNLIEGNNTITVVATDAAGNTTTLTRNVKLDTICEVTVNHIPDITNQQLYTITGTIEAGGTVVVNGQNAQVNGTSFTVTIALSEGTNYITVNATDSLGNKATVNRTIVLDTVPPDLSIDPTPDLTNNSILDLTGLVEAGATVTVNGQDAAVNGTDVFLAYNLAEGTNVLTIVASDAAGNTTIITRTVVLDTTPPALNVNDTPTITRNANLTVAGTLEAGAALTINGETITLDGNSFTKNFTLVEGTNTITLIATDAAGNTTTITKTIILDTTPPALSVISPDDGYVVFNSTTTMIGNVEPGSTLYINGVAVTTDADGDFTVNLNLLMGTNTISLSAVDAAGNVTNLTRTLILKVNQLTNLTINPNPIKIGTSAYIYYTTTQTGYVTINVYNKNGLFVKTVFSNLYKVAGSYSATWDTRDKLGNLVTDADYKIVVELKDSTGAVIGRLDKTQLAARVPAVISSSAAPLPFNPLIGEQVTINYTLNNYAIVTVQIFKSTTLVKKIIVSVMQNPGANSVVWDGRDMYGNLVADATYTYQIDAVSPLVASFKSTYKGSTTVEKEPPQISAFTVSNPLKITTSATIKFTLSENAYVTININDSNGNLVRNLLVSMNKIAGSNTVNWDSRDNNGNYVPEGYYTVVISAVDYYGKFSGEQSYVIAAGYSPLVSNAAVNPNPFNPLIGENGTITYTLSNDALVTVQILKGTTSIRTITTGLRQSAGTNTIIWDGRDNNGNIMPDAAYTYQIDTVSPLVPTFKNTFKGSITVEKEPPQVTNLGLSADPYKISSYLTISYTLSENGTVTVKIYDNAGNLVRTLADNVSKIVGNNSINWDGRDDNGNLVPEGTYTVSIIEIDNFGKFSGEVTRSFTAGYVPVISNSSTAPEPFNPLDGQYATITYTLSNDSMVTVQIFKGSALVRTIISGQRQSAGINSVIWDGRDNNGNIVGDAAYTYQIDAISPLVSTFKAVSNKGTTTVEKEAPQVTNLSASSDPYRIGSNVTINYTLSENGTVNITILDSAGNLVRTIATTLSKFSGSNTAMWDGRDNNSALVPEGYYTIVVSEYDNFNKYSGELTKTITAGYVPAISNNSSTPEPFNPLIGQNATINYNISTNALVTIQIFKGSTLIKTILSAQLQQAGVNTVVWDGTDNNGNIVGDAAYTYQIDAVSPLVPSFRALTIRGTTTVEKEAPQVTNLSFSTNPYKIGYSLSLNYTISENGLVSAKVLDSNGHLIRTLLDSVAKTSGKLTVNWDGRDDNGNLVPEGIYTFVVSEYDNFNNYSGEVTDSVTAGYMPVITNNNSAPEPFNPYAGEVATISYNLSNDSLVTVQIFKGSTLIRTIISGQLQAAGINSVIWDGLDNNGNTVGDAVYTYQIDASSPLVASFKATLKGSATVEKEAPKVTNLNVIADPFKIGSYQTISYILSENGTVTVKILNSDGTIIRTILDGAAKISGSSSITWDGRDDLGNLVPEGVYTVWVSETDNFNKLSEPVTRSFTAGYQPTVTTEPVTPNPFNPKAGEIANITYDLSNDAVVTIQVFKGSTLIRTLISAEGQSAGVHTVLWDGRDNNGNIVGDAAYTVQIDTQSPLVSTFKSTSRLTVNTDTGAPEVTNITTSATPYILGNILTITYNISENSIVSIRLYDKAGNLVRTLVSNFNVNAGTNTIRWDGKDDLANLAAQGVYTLEITANDSYNAPATVTYYITAVTSNLITVNSGSVTTFDPTLGQSAVIDYHISQDATPAYSILLGNTVIKGYLLPDIIQPAGNYQFSWDGTDNNGNIVSPGQYVYQISANGVIYEGYITVL